MEDTYYQSRRFPELRAFYTQKDLNEAISKNKLFFFDIVYFSGYNMEHDGYSDYYRNIDSLLEATYNFIKNNKSEIIAGDKSVHLRSVDKIIPDFEYGGNGNIIGYMSVLHKTGEEDKIRITLDKRLDYDLDSFIKLYDDIVLYDNEENKQKVIKR